MILNPLIGIIEDSHVGIAPFPLGLTTTPFNIIVSLLQRILLQYNTMQYNTIQYNTISLLLGRIHTIENII